MNNNVIINPISMGSEAFDTYIDVDDAVNADELKSSGNFIGANTVRRQTKVDFSLRSVSFFGEQIEINQYLPDIVE